MAFSGIVQADRVKPALYGLLSVADVTNHGASDEHWAGGFEYETEACALDASIVDICGGPDIAVLNDPDAPRSFKTHPFGIKARDRCLTPGLTVQDRRARVLRQLELVTQKAVEYELWTGTYTRQIGGDGRYLTSSDAKIVGAPGSLPTPGAPTTAPSPTGGTLSPDTYSYRITAVNAAGETIASEPGTATTPTVVIPPPNTPTATVSETGGTLAPGTYSYRVSAINAQGETLASAPVSATVATATGAVTVNWTAPTVPAGTSAITGYRVYGRSGTLTRLGQTAAGTLTFTDTGAAGTGEALPTENTTTGRQGSVTLTWAEVVAPENVGPVTNYRIYGRSGTLTRLAQVAAGTTTYTDTGAAGTGEPLPTSDTSDLPYDAYPVKRAVALLEGALAQCGAGVQGVIHMSRDVASAYLGKGELDPPPAAVSTGNGTLIAAGTGYDGRGPGETGPPPPTSTKRWIYATGPIHVHLGPGEIVTPERANAVDTATNIATYVALRPAVTFWDGCCHFAVQVDLAES